MPRSVNQTQVPSAVFIQPPMGTVGLTEEQAREAIAGDIDVYVSKFRAMKNTITGRGEKSLVKIIVEVATDKVQFPSSPAKDAGSDRQLEALPMRVCHESQSTCAFVARGCTARVGVVVMCCITLQTVAPWCAQIMGVHMVGPDAPEIMQGVAIAMKAGATKAHFDSTVGLRPMSAKVARPMPPAAGLAVARHACSGRRSLGGGLRPLPGDNELLGGTGGLVCIPHRGSRCKACDPVATP